MHDMFDDLLGTRRGSQRPLAKRTDRDLPQYGLKITPSAAARRLAGQLWPDVQKQRRLAPGVYGFTCAGHGGVIAVIGKAQLSPAHVAAARDAELTELVVIAPGKTYSTAARLILSSARTFFSWIPNSARLLFAVACRDGTPANATDIARNG